MNIKVAAFTVRDKSINTYRIQTQQGQSLKSFADILEFVVSAT